jgi:hypothetical protein
MEKVLVVKAIAGERDLLIDKMENSLESLQEFIDGYIEPVKLSDNLTMWVNEEGKMRQLTTNFYLYKDNVRLDSIVGNALFTSVNEEGDIISLNDSDIHEIQAKFLTRGKFQL